MVLVAAAHGDDNSRQATTRIESKRHMSIVIRTSDNQTLTFEKDIIRVGCSERSDVRFSRQQVASEHAELQKIGGRWLIKSVGEEIIHVEGKPSGRMIWLQPGDCVRINAEGVGFVFQPSEPAGAPQIPVSSKRSATSQPGPVVSSRNSTADQSTSVTSTLRTAPSDSPRSAAVKASNRQSEQPPELGSDNRLLKYILLSGLVLVMLAGGGWLLMRNGKSVDAVTATDVEEAQRKQSKSEDNGDQQVNQASQDAAVVEGRVQQDAVVKNRIQQVMQRRLMIGFEVNSERKLLGQVWAMDGDSVIGSALLFENLLKTPEQVKIFVHSSAAGDPVSYLDRDSIRNHVAFSMEDTGTMHSAVGKARLSKPLNCAPLDPAAEVLSAADLVEGMQVLHHGFCVPLVANKAPTFDLTAPPAELQLEGQISYVSPEAPSIIRVKFPAWDSSAVILEGGFVATITGQLAGTLANGNPDSKEFNLIPIDRVHGLR